MSAAKILLAIMITFTITACGTMKHMKEVNIGLDFDTSARNYIQLVRWHEIESAANTYVTPSLLEAYRKRAAAAAEVKIGDYRVPIMECDPVKGEGKAKVEFDYYRPPSTTVHTVVDIQRWSYEEENGRHIWRLQTLLPEFK